MARVYSSRPIRQRTGPPPAPSDCLNTIYIVADASMSRAAKIAEPVRRAAGHTASADSGRENFIVQKPVDELVRAACVSGHLNMSARIPALTACPNELFDLFADDMPPWWSYAGATPDASATATWSKRTPLRALVLTKNNITALDERIAHFDALHRLDVRENRLSALPSTFTQLVHLTSLHLSQNAFTKVPTCILSLPALETLDLSHNRLETLWTPDDVDQCGVSPLKILPSLSTLDLSYNRLNTSALVHMPASLGQLNLKHNVLRHPIPIDVLHPAKRLEELVLAENELPDAVFALNGSSFALPHLRVLDVRATRVASLAPLESHFASAPSMSLGEAKDKTRSPVHAPVCESPACTPHQLVRVSNIPARDKHEVLSVATQHSTILSVLYVLSDVQVRSESHRRRRGGRGRGGEDRTRSREERDEDGHSVTPNAGSALANAKLSTKKKEALGQVPCKFYRNNGCSAGDACPFAHTLPGEGQPKAVCQWYIKGSCRFGHRCALAHILPGQPMSMDRKNKRSAQHGSSQTAAKQTEEQQQHHTSEKSENAKLASPSPSGMGATAMFIPSRTSNLGEELAVPASASSADAEPTQSGWSHDITRPRTYDATGTSAFGTSPFNHPGSHGLFFNTHTEVNGSQPTSPWSSRKNEDALAESAHAEDFLPSSLSDLLTPTELERRMRSNRDASSTSSSLQPPSFMPEMISQSMPATSHHLGSFNVSPPAPHGQTPTFGGSSFSFMSGGVQPTRRPGSHSVHASPFMPPIFDNLLGSPPSLSPPGTLSSSLGGERVPMSMSTSSHKGLSDDARRRTSSSALFHGRGTVPISPAIVPVSEEDADDAIFELE